MVGGNINGYNQRASQFDTTKIKITCTSGLWNYSFLQNTPHKCTKINVQACFSSTSCNSKKLSQNLNFHQYQWRNSSINYHTEIQCNYKELQKKFTSLHKVYLYFKK